MRVLANGKWCDGYLDYHRASSEYRIRTRLCRTLVRVEGLYFERPKSIGLLFNYWREVGMREVIRKVVARSAERLRNRKYISCGVGEIMESASEGELRAGQLVVFIAPSHPACTERIVLPARLLLPTATALPSFVHSDVLYYSDEPLPGELKPRWESLAGWNPWSGTELPPSTDDVLREAQQLIQTTDWEAAQCLPLSPQAAVSERRNSTRSVRGRIRKSAVLVGYGNYAKTIVLPNVRRYLDVTCVQEVDPTQIPFTSNWSWSWDTAAVPRESESYDAWLIAGYHHTHAPLAVRALHAGSYAVVEKPLATDLCQLDRLVRAVNESQRYFAGFHKRYSPMNDWARADLRVKSGDAIDYHCIVYEVPLPPRHWYRWPVSRSRIVSNGCHWIDHFLFLNCYAPVESLDVQQTRGGTVSCLVTLSNGGCFTMLLTDHGAERIGLQEYVELRANGATVRMVDGVSYRAENSRRIVRRARVHKYSGFKRMYRSISCAIRRGDVGDSPISIDMSSRLVLELEARLLSPRL